MGGPPPREPRESTEGGGIIAFIFTMRFGSNLVMYPKRFIWGSQFSWPAGGDLGPCRSYAAGYLPRPSSPSCLAGTCTHQELR